MDLGIDFIDSFERIVSCRQIFGTGDYFHLYVDKGYYCIIFLRDGRWQAYLDNKGAKTLTIDDIQVLGEMIMEKYPDYKGRPSLTNLNFP